MNNKEIFLQAINDKKIVKVKIDTYEKWIIERHCIPFDFWPSRRNLKVNPDRFHFYDLDSPDNKHNLSIIPEQLVSIEITGDNFEPWVYVNWKPIQWFYKRDWGKYS